jgi:hypothetical protein
MTPPTGLRSRVLAEVKAIRARLDALEQLLAAKPSTPSTSNSQPRARYNNNTPRRPARRSAPAAPARRPTSSKPCSCCDGRGCPCPHHLAEARL